MPDARRNRVFKLERDDIRFPIWRKKVDGSIFNERMITVPNSFVGFWKLKRRFAGIRSKRDEKSIVPIFFEGEKFAGNITGHKTRSNLFRISYGADLAEKLKDTFAMSFMRDLEFKLGDYANDERRENIEDLIPFWEFLDVEYDDIKNEIFFTCHYRQRPHFSHLFKKIVDSTILSRIELEFESKHEKRIINSKWYPRSELKNHFDAKNVLYFLLDEPSQQIYVGEASSLKSRLSAKRPEIPTWTHFRYDILPPLLEPFRVEIEFMMISAFMNLCRCDSFKGKPKIISEYQLMNKKYLSK
ncbi:MAG: GIY-YIG nuclease family protein [Acidobacteriota bacterium]|nr:MAG: GIY-YIG nuclease family protein [Acidobacteriota bacterium]